MEMGEVTSVPSVRRSLNTHTLSSMSSAERSDRERHHYNV